MKKQLVRLKVEYVLSLIITIVWVIFSSYHAIQHNLIFMVLGAGLAVHHFQKWLTVSIVYNYQNMIKNESENIIKKR